VSRLHCPPGQYVIPDHVSAVRQCAFPVRLHSLSIMPKSPLKTYVYRTRYSRCHEKYHTQPSDEGPALQICAAYARISSIGTVPIACSWAINSKRKRVAALSMMLT